MKLFAVSDSLRIFANRITYLPLSMNQDERVKYWLDIVAADLDTAEYLFAGGRWLYAAFMCHQVIEKILKAYWTAIRDDDPPYTHSYAKLLESCGLLHP